jgi:hypothetical protein
MLYDDTNLGICFQFQKSVLSKSICLIINSISFDSSLHKSLLNQNAGYVPCGLPFTFESLRHNIQLWKTV